jgi:hypothetical protein
VAFGDVFNPVLFLALKMFGYLAIGAMRLQPRRPHELNDFHTHENSSHTASAIRPASASDIRYAVMLIFSPT